MSGYLHNNAAGIGSCQFLNRTFYFPPVIRFLPFLAMQNICSRSCCWRACWNPACAIQSHHADRHALEWHRSGLHGSDRYTARRFLKNSSKPCSCKILESTVPLDDFGNVRFEHSERYELFALVADVHVASHAHECPVHCSGTIAHRQLHL